MPEELRDEQAETQDVRADKELGIVVRCATSAYAKGRVERAFETLQDRLVKELQLAGVGTREQGNAFLPGFLARYKQRFGVAPADEADVHRPLLKEHRLVEIFTIRTPRVVANNYTVRCRKRVFHVLKRQPARVYPRLRNEVEIRLDGSMHLRHRGNYLNVKDITAAVRVARARGTRGVSFDGTPSDVLDDTGTSGHFY